MLKQKKMPTFLDVIPLKLILKPNVTLSLPFSNQIQNKE